MLVDSHCHLNHIDLSLYGGQLENVLNAARENGVEHILNVCVELKNFSHVLSVAESHKDISCTVGLHPSEKECCGINVSKPSFPRRRESSNPCLVEFLDSRLRGNDDGAMKKSSSYRIVQQNSEKVMSEPSVDQLVALANHQKVVGIGETGLDYFHCQGDLIWQQDRFRRHIQAAKQVNKPLIIHSRQSGQDAIRIMREEGADQVGGVMHCFTDSWEIAKQAMDLNFYISFSGIITYKKAVDVQEVAKKVPLDRLLIETDAPYLAPVPKRGKPNEPAYVKYVAECLAELRGVPFETIAEKTTENFYRLMRVEV